MTTLRLGVLLFFMLLVIVSGADNNAHQETANDVKTTTVKTTTVKTTTLAVEPKPENVTATVVPKKKPVAPVRLTEPMIGKWNYSENNHTCIIVQFAIEMTFTYKTNDNKTNSTTLFMPAANLTTVHGVCNSTNQSISIDWKSSMSQDNEFTLMFTSQDKSGMYSLSEIRITVDPNDLPNITTNESLTFVHKHKQYPTKINNSYRCIQSQKFDLDKHNDTQAYIKISNLQLQAFITTNTTNFGLAQDCPFDTPDYVPITVGCALAGLVVIVLIAYLVGRRRNQAQGYLSM